MCGVVHPHIRKEPLTTVELSNQLTDEVGHGESDLTCPEGS